jgi:hypothetical protein
MHGGGEESAKKNPTPAQFVNRAEGFDRGPKLRMVTETGGRLRGSWISAFFSLMPARRPPRFLSGGPNLTSCSGPISLGRNVMSNGISPWPVLESGANGHPVKTLQYLLRVRGLAPDESRQVEFTIDTAKDLRRYDSTAKDYVVDSGRYEIQVGASSADIRQHATFEISD